MTRLDYFLATKFLAKEAQMIGNFLGYFEKPHSYVKTALATFCATFGKIGLLFTHTSGHTASGQSKQHSRYVDNLFSTSEWRNFAKSGQTDPY